jgi:chromosomal replication initiator protein
MTINYIIKTTCEKWGITEDELLGKDRLNIYVLARREVSIILRKNMKLSYKSIGKILGNRNHTTIINYLKSDSDNIVDEK